MDVALGYENGSFPFHCFTVSFRQACVISLRAWDMFGCHTPTGGQSTRGEAELRTNCGLNGGIPGLKSKAGRGSCSIKQPASS
jgi:hypothetical protein